MSLFCLHAWKTLSLDINLGRQVGLCLVLLSIQRWPSLFSCFHQIVVSLYTSIMCPLSLTALKIFSLSFGFHNLTMMCQSMIFFIFIQVGDCWDSWIYKFVLHKIWEVFAHYFFKYFWHHFLFSFGTLIKHKLDI